MTTPFEPGGVERTERLNDALEGLSHLERSSICNHLVGSLACYVDDDLWRVLVSAAVESLVLDVTPARLDSNQQPSG